MELLRHATVLDQGELKFVGNKGEGVKRPALERRIIFARLLEAYQMPEGPGDSTATALNVPFLLWL